MKGDMMSYGPSADGAGAEEEGAGDDSADLELSAAKDAMAAKSPEEWAAAMKAFGEACGWTKHE